jgi:hypothetical protein
VTSNSQSRIIGRFGSRRRSQEIEFTGSYRLLIAVGGVDQEAPLEIEHAPADAHPRPSAGYPGRSAQQALDPRQQFARLEGLRDVVVGLTRKFWRAR